MCRPCIRLYKTAEDQAVGLSQLLRIDPNLGFLDRIVEIVLFLFVRASESVICIPDSDQGFAVNFRFAARC